MFKSTVKLILSEMLLNYRRYKRGRILSAEDKRIVKLHPEWKGLNEREKSFVLDKDIWQYIIFKNLRGSLEEGYVSDVIYTNEMLGVLFSFDFFTQGKITKLGANLFSNKAYFPVLLKYLPLPKTLVMNINSVFLDSDYEIITEDKALQIMNNYPQLVFKPATGTAHTGGVALISKEYYKQTMHEYEKYARGGGAMVTSFKKSSSSMKVSASIILHQ